MALVVVVECRCFLVLKIVYCQPQFSCVYIYMCAKICCLNMELYCRICAQLTLAMKNIVLTSLHEIMC